MTMQINLLDMTPTRKGRVRGNGPKAKVLHVEESECEGLPVGVHELTNTDRVTFCRWCGLDWQTLDAELNAVLRGAE